MKKLFTTLFAKPRPTVVAAIYDVRNDQMKLVLSDGTILKYPELEY